MKANVAARRLRQIAGGAETRRQHFRDARGVRGELEEKRVVEAVESLDRDVEFLETLAAALLRSRPSTTVRELLAEVEGAAPTTVIEV